ncbi:MAG: Dipeptidyl-peptidase 6 [Chloroflexi bacterium ADurb.Bin325]|nr:MAG: Dipeptidyl-peptidase 6 [Chloroflexi bacterium ADurb.Bin325]
MLDDITRALAEVGQPFDDTRTHYCQVQATALDEGRCTLAGAVLDDATLAALLDGLAARFPAIRFETAGVYVLRAAQPRTAAVGTNLTGLYAKPSFLAEQVSQLLNGWPLEILMTEGRWAFVRQADGYLGWAYAPYLAPAHGCAFSHLVSAAVSLLRAEPSPAAPIVTRIMGGAAVAVDAVDAGWSHVTLAGDSAGWVPAGDLRAFSVLPQDTAARRGQMLADAARFTGVPYLWGGCSALGIDCSGFSQLLHRLVGVTLPRDADMQFDAGRPVEAPFEPGDLLFFGEAGETRSITHVAVSLGGWRIVHASRSRNGVYEDDVQAVEHLRESFVGARRFI